MTRKSLLRHFKYFNNQRKLCTSVVLRSDDYILKSSMPDIVMPNMRFLDRLWIDSANFKNHVAIECVDTQKTYTYNQLQKNMAIFATSLHKKLGLKSGDVVCTMLPNCPEFVVAAFGAIQAGCVLTTINPIYKDLEVSHQVAMTEPKVIVTIPECYNAVVSGLKNAKSNAKIVVVNKPGTGVPDGVIKFSEIAESGEVDHSLLDKIEKKLDDVAFIPFSSGTTGLPKGVEISYKNILAAMEIMTYKDNNYPILTNGEFQDVIPCVLPFFHVYGLIVTLVGHLTKGCKLVTMPKFSATSFLDILKNKKASVLYIVPPLAILLGKHPDVNEEHFRHVRHIACGAAPLAGSDVEAILEKSNKEVNIGQGFGATETTSLGSATVIGSKTDYSACGVPMSSMEFKFVDPATGKAVPIGEQGELYIRGPVVMKGYHKNEKATKDSITEDNFYKTGDLGYYKQGVGLYITDRIKELIKVRGMQVAPAELESILRLHPAVQEAAVIGVPHEYYGEAPKACIKLKNGITTSPVELQSFVADKVASFKKIEEVVFVDDLPKTSSGKILRRELKKMYA